MEVKLFGFKKIFPQKKLLRTLKNVKKFAYSLQNLISLFPILCKFAYSLQNLIPGLQYSALHRPGNYIDGELQTKVSSRVPVLAIHSTTVLRNVSVSKNSAIRQN